jgi:uncharacterized YccA/Bax inhibitor family protein
MFQSNNPALRNDAFAPTQTWDSAMGTGKAVGGLSTRERSTTMTLSGTVWKSFILLIICAIVGVAGWGMISANPSLLFAFWGGGALTGLVLGLVVTFRPKTAPFLAPLYAIAQGAFVAGASVWWTGFASAGKAASLGTGLVTQAGLITFGVAACMLVAYGTRLIKPTERMLAGIAAATGGVILAGFLMFLASFLFPNLVMGFWDSPLGLAFAGLIVVIAAFNLVSDFALIENGVQNKAPKYMEWYGGFALLVTLVWLYISILRLLAMLRRD